MYTYLSCTRHDDYRKKKHRMHKQTRKTFRVRVHVPLYEHSTKKSCFPTPCMQSNGFQFQVHVIKKVLQRILKFALTGKGTPQPVCTKNSDAVCWFNWCICFLKVRCSGHSAQIKLCISVFNVHCTRIWTKAHTCPVWLDDVLHKNVLTFLCVCVCAISFCSCIQHVHENWSSVNQSARESYHITTPQKIPKNTRFLYLCVWE